jgi:CxxC motif-containing protein (DUF1111 family)
MSSKHGGREVPLLDQCSDTTRPGAARSRMAPLGAIAVAIPLLAGVSWQAVATGANERTDIAELLRPPTRFDIPEPGEESPGGMATSRKSVDNSNAFSNSSGNLDFKREFDFKIGNAVFRKLWVSAPASTKSSDGLGPLYNARGCQNCHLKDGRGHPPAANWPQEDAMSFLMRLSVPPRTDEERKLIEEGRIKSVDEAVYGGQLQPLSIQGHVAEGKIHIDYTEEAVTLAGGKTIDLRKPHYGIEHLGYGSLDPQVMLSPRVAPQMIGLGLLELVPEEQILAHADPDDRNGDGISGRAQRVWSAEQQRVALGRFGHKAGAPSVSQQSADAFAGDIGISTPLVPRPSGDCTPAQPFCLNAPNGGDVATGTPEVEDKLFKLVAFYSRNLAVPARRNPAAPDILAGKAAFHAAGCASCHQPKFVTGSSEDQPHLGSQLIWPYTDLLLHDMGEGLADDRPEGMADGREWRTAPLWGIGLTQIVNGHTLYLHDGRARSIEEAIMWHGGEAKAARDAFAGLSEAGRERLIAFVNSL